MNIAELKKMVDAALERGLDPRTTVVMDGGSGEWLKLDKVDDPTQRGDGSLLWFTLFPGDYADSRMDYGHEVE